MAFVVEDGSGLATATSLASVVELADYATDTGVTLGDTTSQQRSLIAATAYVLNESRFRYRGTRASATQALAWPRTGVVLRDGPALPDGTIPYALKRAVCALAARVSSGLTASLQPDLANGGLLVQTKTIDVLTTTYMRPEGGGGPTSAETIYPEVMGLIATFLREAHMGPYYDSVAPTLLHTNPAPFADGTYDVSL